MSDRASRIDRLDVAAYTVPTDAPEADGTLSWDATTIVVVEVATASGVTESATPTAIDASPT